ncbi:hypothetical protein A2Z67_02580 [Candidatus Woesebacteria bacterium RBG_13_36_22]|uniref:Uncharacterized protein n=1 Tax=Candidatus Woesebacteria bacterium RBG_13_36_22 TaxID=1802478 RepID=A0A1F7X1M3_9BACT|nr:MAG: hypothetical protein A2Z67_02580 [Candidatus Woesebacteria bacterium RBG_13_36_22]
MNDHIKNICKIGQGYDCCRYLIVGPNGFECAKNTSLSVLLDSRVENKTITARGDNCKGRTIEELNKK